jgi:hypothetical protein
MRSRLQKVPAGLALSLWIAALLLAVALWWAGRALNTLFTEPQGVVAGQQRQVADFRDTGLEIVGWLERNRAPKGTLVRAWYRLRNIGSAPIGSLRGSFFAPGFSPAPVPGKQQPLPRTFPIYWGASNVLLPADRLPTLAPGANLDLRLEMVGNEQSGDYMVTASFAWRGPRGTTQEATLDLGPLRLRSPALEQIAAWKDLALAAAPLVAPLLVLLLGFVFQNRQQRLVQERQAWASMLPFSHETNSKFYLPLISDVQTFEAELKKFRESKAAADRQSAFFYLLRSLQGVRRVLTNGGFYLKNRHGEQLVACCWDDFSDNLLSQVGPRAELSYVVDALGPDDSLSDFIRKLNYSVLREKEDALEEKFAAWVVSGGDFKKLSLFRILFEFEINAIYTFWYGDEEKFPFDEYERVWEEFRKAGCIDETVIKVHRYVYKLLSWKQKRRLRSA